MADIIRPVEETDEQESLPIIHVISDSSGQTATNVLLAAMSQFENDVVKIEHIVELRRIDEVRRHLDACSSAEIPSAVFHTIADYNLRSEVRAELTRRGIPSIDLLGPEINIISSLTGEEPLNLSGRRIEDDERYHSRLKGMNFFAEHDEGLNPHDLGNADAVLFGVSRTSKTPLSLFLAFQGLKMANVTYTLDADLPDELFTIDPRRIFGLVRFDTSDEEASSRDLADRSAGASHKAQLAGSERGVEKSKARAIMETLGCQIINIDGCTIEDLATKILDRIKELEETSE